MMGKFFVKISYFLTMGKDLVRKTIFFSNKNKSFYLEMNIYPTDINNFSGLIYKNIGNLDDIIKDNPNIDVENRSLAFYRKKSRPKLIEIYNFIIKI